MGKKTLYHPISLHVIRGSAEYCGFQFGKIKQVSQDPVGGSARYTCEVVRLSDIAKQENSAFVQLHLQNCFMDNIRVHWLRTTKSGVLLCDLQIDIRKAAKQKPLEGATKSENGRTK